MFFPSSQIHRRQRNLSDRTNLETVALSNRSRVFRKNLIAWHNVNMLQILRDGFHREPKPKKKKKNDIKYEQQKKNPYNCPNTTVQTSIGVARFVSPIFWYRSLSVSAFKPCHGSDPLRKYINIWPKASKSSRLDCSLPICVFIDIYRAVPVSDLCSRYGICLFVSKSIYSLANPKSVNVSKPVRFQLRCNS